AVDHDTEKQAVEAARNGPDLKTDLKLAKVSAYIGKGIKGTQADVTDLSSPKPQKVDILGPHVDITVQNLATAPSLITEAKARFRN
ncbi:hypothetical protein, partial [Klebsiella pneumoniae]|uniref:hypothetical protein n=1 Tax=Klebsiella pneumoniae TaxID=573 RepID=UPI0025A2316E